MAKMTTDSKTWYPHPMNMDQTHLLGNDWAATCQFSPLSNREVLDLTLERVKQTENPVVILDLDSTLYEVRTRTRHILQEWVRQSHGHTHPWTGVFNAELHQVGYSVADTFHNLGFNAVPLKEQLPHAKAFWNERFFTNEYLTHDLPYAGVSEFAHRLHQQGAHVVYLTGRDEPSMGIGTRQNLLRDQLPWEIPRTSLFLKPERAHNDLEFKKVASQEIRKLGNVVASFENEPVNVVGLSTVLPEAMHVFVHTVFSDHPAPVKHGLYRITDFASSI